MLGIKSTQLKELLEMYREISLLGKVNGLLGWDLNVNLPKDASSGRAEQTAYITKLITRKWQSKRFRSLLEKVKTEKGLSEKEKAIIRNLEHSAKYYHRVSEKTIVELSRTTSKAFVSWNRAKNDNNYSHFLPHLERIIDLSIEIANALGYKENPYDALLGLYEPGFTFKKGNKIFELLVKELSPFVKKITNSEKAHSYKSPFVESAKFSEKEQKEISLKLLERIGYDFGKGRLDVSPHPFTQDIGANDVRITTRYKDNDFTESLMIALHEGGHALYEQGVDTSFEYTPLEGGVSLGIHESQSRFWENQVGRSPAFVKEIESDVESTFGQRIKDSKNLLPHFCRVTPGPIRVEADEVTYNLHIALRFEMEEAIINGKVKAKYLPEIWNEKMKKYLGIVPENDSEGVLQDVHWSYGSFGYFPTYTLGNLYAAQFTHTMEKTVALEKTVRAGDYKKLLDWQRENIHKYGSSLWPDGLVKNVTGEKLNADYFINYIKKKYSKIYLLD